jgi:hypothetical protein
VTRTRTAAVRGSVAAILALAACGPADHPPPQRAARVPVPAVTAPDLAVEELHRVLGAHTTLSPPARNPFRFPGSGQTDGVGAGRSARAPLPPPEGLPVLPLPLAQPPLRLLGFVTLTDGTKVAVLSVGSDLVMARVGEVVAARFRVVSIVDDAVDLTDAVGERPMRLALP